MYQQPETPRIALLLSGGLDSCILLGELLQKGYTVLPIYVDSGLIWQDVELACLQRFLEAIESKQVERLNRLEIPLDDVYQGHWSLTGTPLPAADSADTEVYLPGRNPLLLVKAAICCQNHGIDDLAIAVLGTSPFADAKPSFLAQFTEVMNMALGSNLRIHVPYAGTPKAEIMKRGDDLPLQWTFSCLSPLQQLHCGRCNKCQERRNAFRQAAREDPTEYATDGIAVSPRSTSDKANN